MTEVLLYNPPSSGNKKPVLPISLLALGALLEGRREYEIVDGNLVDDPLQELDQRVRETGASILGVTVMPGPQLENAVEVCARLKLMHPALTVVWGGYFPTQHWDVCLRSPYIDYVLRGHNEHGFVELIESLLDGRSPRSIQGLAFRHALGDRANPLPPVPDPNELPALLPYHRVPVERYIRDTYLGSRTIGHHSSYGCPFLCNFCAVVNMVGGRWLAQSGGRTAQVVEHLHRNHGVNAVEFYDNNFFTHEARTVEYVERIEHLGVSWWGEGRIDTLLKYKDESWRQMKRAGLRMIFLGAESGSQATLEAMDKGGTQTPEKTLELARRMAEFGVVPEMSFVVGNPPHPEQDAADTMRFIREVKKVNPETEIIMYMYTPVPLSGTLYEEAKQSGFQFPETLEDWVSPKWAEFSQRRSANVPWMEDPVQRAIKDFQKVLNAYYPTTTDLSLRRGRRFALRAAASWRYRLGFYKWPYELSALHRLLPYQRPETSGF